MRRYLLSAAAAAAVVGLASPASAAVTFSSYNGPDLTTAIKASTTDTDNNTTQVFGCTQNDGQCANVMFTGLKADGTTGTTIHITDGAGFASITDPVNPQDLYNLVIQMADGVTTFTQFMFSLQLVNDGTVSVYYLLSSGGGWQLATPSFSQKANGNNTYFLQGGVFSAVMVSSTSPIKEYKQNSITLGSVAVPEPASWALMLLGFGGMGMALRRSRRRGNQTLMQVA